MKSTVKVLAPVTLAFAAFSANAGLIESNYSLQPHVAATAGATTLAQYTDTAPKDNAPSVAPQSGFALTAQYTDTAPKDNAPSVAPQTGSVALS